MNIEFLIKKYHKLIYSICFNLLNNSLDAQDITQETYISIYTNLDKYDNLPENEIKNIVCKIALNKCKDFLKLKTNKLKVTETTEDELSLYIDNVNIEENLITEEKKKYIHKMINELKEPYRKTLYKYYVEEISLDNLSKQLDIPKPTLKIQIYRGKEILKEKFKKGGVDLYE